MTSKGGALWRRVIHDASGRFLRDFFRRIHSFLWNIDIFLNYHVIKRIWNEFSFHTVIIVIRLFVLYPLAKGSEISKAQLVSYIPYEMKIHFRSYIWCNIEINHIKTCHLSNCKCPASLCISILLVVDVHKSNLQWTLIRGAECACHYWPWSLHKHPDSRQRWLYSLTTICAGKQCVRIQQKYYKQVIGCAIRACPSPQISDIRMYEITKDIIAQCQYRHKIIFHGRFRDDGFIIFDGDITEATQLFNIANDYHPLLKFTYNISESHMTFLDTKVYKGTRFQESGILDIKLYIKPTHTFQYLHRTSAQSKSVFKGFIKGECIRHARNTSDRTILLERLQEFQTHLTKRGYSIFEVQPIVHEISTSDRNELLKRQINKRKS